MPGAKTYQAIGYATYHGGRFYGKKKRMELEPARKKRQDQTRAGVAVAAVVLVAVVALAARRASSVPTV